MNYLWVALLKILFGIFVATIVLNMFTAFLIAPIKKFAEIIHGK